MIAVTPPSHPQAHRHRPVLLAAAVLTCSALFPKPGEGAPPPRPTSVEIVEQLKQTLPAGWTVRPTVGAGLPAGWQSSEASAVTLQFHDGTQELTACAVPLDWVGVQLKGTPTDTVFRAATIKLILPAGTERTAWLDTLACVPASLGSAEGSTHAYAGQYARVEAEIRTLLRKSGPTRDQAVASLIALGVPAEDLIREAALDPRSPSRLAAIHSLRHFPGRATREALARIIADRSRDAAADSCRLAAIDTCTALLLDTHGPAIVTALQAEKDEATATRLAAEVGRLRYAAAAPELRRWLKAAQSIEAKVVFARVLATLRDPAAAAEIRAAIDAPAPRRAAITPPTDAGARRQLALELHRLTGTWGAPVRGSRLSLMMESPDRIMVSVENLGQGPLRFIPFMAATGQPWPVGLEITLDGQAISPPGPGAADIGRASDISREIAPGSVATFSLQLPHPLSTSGEHTLAATWFDLAASALTLRAGTVVAAQP